jgi:hypothetical protein
MRKWNKFFEDKKIEVSVADLGRVRYWGDLK